MHEKRPTILLVEDNELDVEKIERGFSQLKISNPVVHAHDGVEALEIMRGQSGREKILGPYVLLMDLSLPRMSGLELLAEIRADSQLVQTPVFVLTTSDRAPDIEAAYRHNVAGYVVKPLNREGMFQALESLSAFWEINLLPQSP